jgi:hypothetical protein
METVTGRLAWNAYWALFVLGSLQLLVWAVVEAPRGLDWSLLLSVPFLLASLNLVLFSRSHEQVCSIEVERHNWLRALTMGGYPAWAFAGTGVLLVGFAVWLGYFVFSG